MLQPDQLRVCMLSAEVWPYARAGALARVVSNLSSTLAETGTEVIVIAPLYGPVRGGSDVRHVLDLGAFRIGSHDYPVSLYADVGRQPVRNYFIASEDFFDRDGIYADPVTGNDYPDNFERFNLFMRAAVDALSQMHWQADIIHCHDSHTALVPAHLKLQRMGEPFFSSVSTLLTIYNLRFQGQFDGGKFPLTGLPPELFYSPGPFEYYGKLNSLKAGICYAEVLNTLSRQYARDIQTEEYGNGLEVVLQRRKDDLSGILNGIDTAVWNPEADSLCPAPFSADDLSGKQENKRALQQACGLPVLDVPLIGYILSQPRQEGIDLFLEERNELLNLECQWVIVDGGLSSYRSQIEALQVRRPDTVSIIRQVDDSLLHRIYSGCDMLLMPARHDPAGLHAMRGMRYGAIPVVRHCGALADIVHEFKPDNSGHGFKFYGYGAADLLKTVQKALQLWKEQRERWVNLTKNAMRQDFSWRRAAGQYLDLYRKAHNHR